MDFAKRMTWTLIAALAVLLTGTALLGTVAAEPTAPGVNAAPESTQAAAAQNVQPAENRGPNYVDADSNGICDNRPVCGQGGGSRSGYADANGDGICDNQGAGACRQRNGQGGARCGQADANGYGIRDNQGMGGRHRHRGGGQGRCQGRVQGNR